MFRAVLFGLSEGSEAASDATVTVMKVHEEEKSVKAQEFFEYQFDKFALRVSKGYWYAGYDTWVRVRDSDALVGITDFFQTKLGDVLYVDPEQADEIEQDDVLATLESVKAAVDITCPASGELLEFNPALEHRPELVNEDPFGEGWIARIRLTDWEADREMLLSAEAYFKLMQDKVAKELERE